MTDRGLHRCKVMLFGLKNTGATYQCLVNKFFKPLLENSMEAYMDDMIVKSRQDVEHNGNLRRTFEIFRTYGIKLNL